jgi:hypothetical protein
MADRGEPPRRRCEATSRLAFEGKEMPAMLINSKALTALALVLAFVAACVSFGLIPTLLAVAIAASAAVLATMLGVAMSRQGH